MRDQGRRHLDYQVARRRAGAQITINCVAPGGSIRNVTKALEREAGKGKRAIEATIPLGRIASAEDIAGPILFLSSPLARHITGEILNVNGGSVPVGLSCTSPQKS